MDELSRLYAYDEMKFRNSSARNLDDMVTHEQIVARLIYCGHAVEKALSNDNFQEGRGLDNIQLLVHLLDVYHRRSYDRNHPAYVAALSALKALYGAHISEDGHTQLEGLYGDFFDEIMSCESSVGGANMVEKASKKANGNKNFKELAEGRASVRTYAKKAVNFDTVKEALDIAMKTPTVCNRQAVRIKYVKNKAVIAEILKVQGGVVGYDTPPLLLLVVADDAGYLGANERNQGFVDGGLFAMSILYALEYKGLAACALNATLTEASERTIRGMMGLNDGEKLVTFISVGHFKESNNVCKSFRYDAESIISEVDKIHEFSLPEVEPVGFSERKQPIHEKLKIRSRAKAAARRLKQVLRPRTRLMDARETLARRARTQRFKHLDGAIITLIDYNNYGNILQRYALQEFLLRKGRAFVSYDHELPIKNDLNDGRVRFTAEFVRRHVYVEQLPESHHLANYIAGSDQVWRDFSYDNPKEKIGFFFLNFLKDSSARRIAYAASFGRNSLPEAKITPEISKYLKPLINKFDAVSVREDKAKEMVEEAWGVEATTVIDPTLLLVPEDYSRLIKRSVQDLTPVSGVYAYLIGVTDENEQLLNKAVEYTGKSLYRIDLADYSGPLPPIEQWLLGLRDAELAVIDSFHGAVFSVLNNTNFVVLENKGSGMERMVNLLNLFGIEGRIIKHSEVSSFSFEDLKPIDWPKVNAKLEKLRAESAEWLLKAIASK